MNLKRLSPVFAFLLISFGTQALSASFLKLTRASDGKAVIVELISYDKLTKIAMVKTKTGKIIPLDTTILDQQSLLTIALKSEELALAENKAGGDEAGGGEAGGDEAGGDEDPEDEAAKYKKVKDLPVINFAKNTRKLDIIRKHAGQEILIYTIDSTFDYEKSSTKKHGWLSQYKGLTLWVECELEVKEGWFRATIPSFARDSLSSCPRNPDGYTLMFIKELISEDDKFVARNKE